MLIKKANELMSWDEYEKQYIGLLVFVLCNDFLKVMYVQPLVNHNYN